MSGRKPIPEAERFMEKVDKRDDGCWHWKAYRLSNGYGLFSTGGANRLAHRVSHRLFIGPIDGRDVMHSCDNPSCVNPEHLSLGTRTENMQDAKNKGRMVRGERHGRSKLTEEQVEQIRLSSESQRAIAKRFGICQPHVSDIRTGKKWGNPRERNYHC